MSFTSYYESLSTFPFFALSDSRSLYLTYITFILQKTRMFIFHYRYFSVFLPILMYYGTSCSGLGELRKGSTWRLAWCCVLEGVLGIDRSHGSPIRSSFLIITASYHAGNLQGSRKEGRASVWAGRGKAHWSDKAPLFWGEQTTEPSFMYLKIKLPNFFPDLFHLRCLRYPPERGTAESFSFSFFVFLIDHSRPLFHRSPLFHLHNGIWKVRFGSITRQSCFSYIITMVEL